MLAPAERQLPLAAVTAILIGWGVLAYAAIVEGLFYRCRLNRPQLKPLPHEPPNVRPKKDRRQRPAAKMKIVQSFTRTKTHLGSPPKLASRR